MFLSQEQFSSMASRQIQAQLQYANAFNERIFNGFQKAARLQAVTARTVLENTQSSTRQFFDVRGSADLAGTISLQVMSAPEKLGAYLNQLSKEFVNDYASEVSTMPGSQANAFTNAAGFESQTASSSPLFANGQDNVDQSDKSDNKQENKQENKQDNFSKTLAGNQQDRVAQGMEQAVGLKPKPVDSPRKAAQEIERHFHSSSAQLVENVIDGHDPLKTEVKISH